MASGHSFLFRFTRACVILVLAALVLSPLWLPVIGRQLVNDEGPAKADLIVVLAGDTYGHRIDKAGELVRAGYAPAALVSGPAGMYGNYECDLAIPYAVKHGYPAEWFIPLRNSALSTRQEAAVIVRELRRTGIHSILLLTSDFHTARAARIFRAAVKASGGGIEVRPVAAPDEFFRADSWWKTRASQKTVFMEWSKTLATAVGM